jgi:hypothetical protein
VRVRAVFSKFGQHIRSNVVGYIALFVALTGTAYANGLIITSNRQVGGGTISGHNAPRGDHANVIPASVNGKDLATGAVTSGKLGAGAVSSGNLATGAVSNGKLAPRAVSSGNLAIGAVGSGNLAAGAVTGDKLALNSVGTNNVTDGSLTGVDVADGTLTGADIAAGSLTGAQIDASTLGQVPTALQARIGGFGDHAGNGSCNPSSSGYLDCVIVSLTLPASAKVLLIGQVDAEGDEGSSTGAGYCKLVTNAGDLPGTQSYFYISNSVPINSGLTGITGVLSAGSHDFAVDCDQTSGGLNYFDVGLSAVQLSPN